MVCPGTLFIGDDGAFRCIPMKIGVKSEHWQGGRLPIRPLQASFAWSASGAARSSVPGRVGRKVTYYMFSLLQPPIQTSI
jgi:hypothetical protein